MSGMYLRVQGLLRFRKDVGILPVPVNAALHFCSLSAGVNRISYWPGDPEISLLAVHEGNGTAGQLEAELDAAAAEKLKSSSRPYMGVLLQPLAFDMQQYVEETSGSCDFQEKVSTDLPGQDMRDVFRQQLWKNREAFSRVFLVVDESRHRELLTKMGLGTFCAEPYFSNLRQHMRDLVRLLSSVASSIPCVEDASYGFYRKGAASTVTSPTLSQDAIRHCIIQARLLAYRTGRHLTLLYLHTQN